MGWSDFYPMNQGSINKVPEAGGVYQLNSDSSILYVGQSDNLKRRLEEHLNSDDSCIKKSTKFCYQQSDDPEDLEGKILKDHKNKNGGNLPPCNQQS